MREHIISEIRRIASEQGGKPPGKSLFQRETGIAEHEWSGKYWLRWSEAIEEAGLEPNEFQRKLPRDLILGKYAEVCRHYGRPPTSVELRRYARETPDFIGHNTFSNRFRGKNSLIAALRDWAIENGDDDLLNLLPEVKATQVAEEPADQSKSSDTDGYVYLLKSGQHYKIGRSDNIEKRIKQISVSLPETVKLVHAIRTDDPSGIEAYWHRRFAEQRANGEWFKLSHSDIRAFKRRKYQ